MALKGSRRPPSRWRLLPCRRQRPPPQPRSRRPNARRFSYPPHVSRSTLLMTVLAAPLGPKMSRHQVRGGDMPDLLKRFSDLQRTVQHRTGQVVPAITIQEAGLDGFWIHRALVAAGIESHVVDPASIAVSRRHRRAKTDRIDGEALVRTLMAWRRGEPRVCAMVRVPTPEEEDRRRVCRELKSLIGERIRHVNRVKGVLFAQGIGGYEPRNKDRRDRLEELRTGDGRPLPPCSYPQVVWRIDSPTRPDLACADTTMIRHVAPND